MPDPKSSPEKQPLADDAAEKDKETKPAAATAEADATKNLHQDYIRLTAGNFETAMKELQKLTAARGKEELGGDGKAALAHIKVTGNLSEAALRSNAFAVCQSIFGGADATPQVSAQLESTVQSLSNFLVHGDSELAGHASSCISDARRAAQSIAQTTAQLRDQERQEFLARTEIFLTEARSKHDLLPEDNFSAKRLGNNDQAAGHQFLPLMEYDEMKRPT